MPSVPRMFAFGKELKDKQIRISLPEQEQSVTIECVASNGIPPPDFYWKLNEVLLRSVPLDPKNPGEFTFLNFLNSFIYFCCKNFVMETIL